MIILLQVQFTCQKYHKIGDLTARSAVRRHLSSLALHLCADSPSSDLPEKEEATSKDNIWLVLYQVETLKHSLAVYNKALQRCYRSHTTIN